MVKTVVNYDQVSLSLCKKGHKTPILKGVLTSWAPSSLFKNQVLNPLTNLQFQCNSNIKLTRRSSFVVIQYTLYQSTTMAEDPQDVADRERIFKRFDANGDGQISSAELGEALKALGSVTAEEVKRMMEEIDTDGDGYISYQEFTEFAKANRGLVKDVAKIF